MEAWDAKKTKKGALLNSRGAAWLIINTLKNLSRPGIEHYYSLFSENIPVAWKTGTSYGQRDAWAIGINKQWTIGVWAGNFEGDGNAALSGAGSAAPLLFTLFNTLTVPEEEMWFKKPEDDLEYITCCGKSGLPAGTYCPQTIQIEKPRQTYIPGTCPFHRRFLVDAHSGEEVCSLCWESAQREWTTRYIVPPLVQDIMVRNGYAVDPVPPHKSTCSHVITKGRIQLVYPVNGIRIFVPRDLDGNFEKIVFSAMHQQKDSYLFWYLNGQLIGETQKDHKLAVSPDQGSYRLTIQDEEGNRASAKFSVYRHADLAKTEF
jgi:penicillin-binding protein 1C